MYTHLLVRWQEDEREDEDELEGQAMGVIVPSTWKVLVIAITCDHVDPLIQSSIMIVLHGCCQCGCRLPPT